MMKPNLNIVISDSAESLGHEGCVVAGVTGHVPFSLFCGLWKELA